MAFIKYYTDENIPTAIARQLQAHGVDVLRCQEAGMLEAVDREHLEFATAHERTVVTADQDFLILDAEFRSSGKQHTGIVFITPGKQMALGEVITALLFFHEAVAGGAANLETDIFGLVRHI